MLRSGDRMRLWLRERQRESLHSRTRDRSFLYKACVSVTARHNLITNGVPPVFALVSLERPYINPPPPIINSQKQSQLRRQHGKPILLTIVHFWMRVLPFVTQYKLLWVAHSSSMRVIGGPRINFRVSHVSLRSMPIVKDRGVMLNDSFVEFPISPTRLVRASTGITPTCSGMPHHLTFIIEGNYHVQYQTFAMSQTTTASLTLQLKSPL
ncbi:hypothetical protein Hypma_014458 [Hypsizygus marmoreus]|uniref:Uncharacterized protein n=1 Tax=Hypsizygus marmoreus TaxID=39966 RepID=A0A369JGT4_HYPMA|nr:hypothetical protein Hypma_014458 [Hypsizygus marmoreus]